MNESWPRPQRGWGSDLNASCELLGPDGERPSAALQLPTFTTAAKVRVFITFILCGVSTLCNLAVLWAASGQKRKSHVRVLVINLTVADLLVTFIVMPVDAVWNITVEWMAGDLACRILMFLKLQAMYSCAFVTVVISLDRQFAILNPLAVITARRRNKAMLTAAWTMSAVLSIPQVRAGAEGCSQSDATIPRRFRPRGGCRTTLRRCCNRISCALISFVSRLGGGDGDSTAFYLQPEARLCILSGFPLFPLAVISTPLI